MVQDADIQRLVWLRLIENRAKIYLSLFEVGKASDRVIVFHGYLAPIIIIGALRGGVRRASSARAMLMAQTSMPFQSRKSPSERIARAAGSFRIIR
jgi:hypothetical protein